MFNFVKDLILGNININMRGFFSYLHLAFSRPKMDMEVKLQKDRPDEKSVAIF